MSATSCPAEEKQVNLSAVLSPLYMRKSTVLFLQEEQFGNHLIQMLFVSVFPFLLLILKVFLLKYSLSQSATILHHLRDQLQVTDFVGLCDPRCKVQHVTLTADLGVANNFRQSLGFAQLSADYASARKLEWLHPGSAQPFADLCRDVHLESLYHLFCKNFWLKITHISLVNTALAFLLQSAHRTLTLPPTPSDALRAFSAMVIRWVLSLTFFHVGWLPERL